MSVSITRRRRWKSLGLDDFEDLIVRLHVKQTSLTNIRNHLEQFDTTVAPSTISRFIRSLPAARLHTAYEQREY